jgi:hypothetical protein
MTGEGMSIINKSDVTNQLARRSHREIHLLRSKSEPDATGYSGTESEDSNTNTEHPVKQPLQQPNTSGSKATSIAVVLDPSSVAVPAVTKSVQL